MLVAASHRRRSSMLSPKEPEQIPYGRCAKSDRSRNNQFHLGARPGSAPHAQLPPDARGALARSGDAVMARASLFEDCRIDSLTVIADAQPQPIAVRDLDFNDLSLRVMKC